MFKAKCPKCAAPISLTAKIDNGKITCKRCNCIYTCVYHKKWYEWLVEYGFTMILPLCLALLVYLNVDTWIFITVSFISVSAVIWITPKLRKWVIVNET